MSKGRTPRNLSEAIIRDAMKHTKSNTQAARYLNLTIDTYRKYAKLYMDQETGKTLYELHDNKVKLEARVSNGKVGENT